MVAIKTIKPSLNKPGTKIIRQSTNNIKTYIGAITPIFYYYCLSNANSASIPDYFYIPTDESLNNKIQSIVNAQQHRNLFMLILTNTCAALISSRPRRGRTQPDRSQYINGWSNWERINSINTRQCACCDCNNVRAASLLETL